MNKLEMTFSHPSHTTLHSHANSMMTLAQTGGPARESIPYATFEATRSSRMPIDTDIHWDWRNPLNIIPAIVIGAMLIAIIATWI